MNIEKLKETFFKLYGVGEAFVFFSPSRINLIGEHIDYSGGKVMPCAILLGTYGVVRKRKDNILRFASENIDLRVETSIEELKYQTSHGWANYPKAVIYHILKAGYKVGGMDVLVSGNIPNGAGLSSSASLELLIGEMVNNLFNKGEIKRIDLVKICQRAENEFVGVMCGIMDQFAIGMGKKDKSILLDCTSLDYEYIDFDLKDYTLVIINTNKQRQLSDSKYNERREECEEALRIIKKYKKIDNLCELNPKEFNEISKYIEDRTIRKRAEHAVYENDRVKDASFLLKNGDIEALGDLLIKSHSSLRDLYEVTGKELDTIVDIANNFKGCIGSRMIGAGFGGCAIALVKTRKTNDFIVEVGQEYKKRIGYKADFYISGIGDGTRKIQGR